jgi:hypothetical protein
MGRSREVKNLNLKAKGEKEKGTKVDRHSSRKRETA